MSMYGSINIRLVIAKVENPAELSVLSDEIS